jgi:AcrR family transcriptional regulator
MARRYDHSKEDLKELIIDSAEKIVSKSGYRELTTRKLAQKIGYSHGIIYSYFKNIDDLILCLNSSTLQKMHKQMSAVIDQNKCPITQLEEIGKIYLNLAYNDFYKWDLLFNYQYTKINKIPESYQKLINSVFHLIQTPISKISCNKKLIPDLSHIFWAGVHGIVDLSSKSKLEKAKAKTETELIRIFVKIFISGLENYKN